MAVILVITLLCFGLPDLGKAADDHPLKMSVTTISYDQDKQTYHIDLRMFMDDFLAVTTGKDESNFQGNSSFSTPTKNAVKLYLADNLQISFNGNPIDLKLDKMQIEELTIYVTFKVSDLVPPADIKNILAKDTIFVDRYANQRNVIHIEFPDRRRKSLLFNSYQREGTLEF